MLGAYLCHDSGVDHGGRDPWAHSIHSTNRKRCCIVSPRTNTAASVEEERKEEGGGEGGWE